MSKQTSTDTENISSDFPIDHDVDFEPKEPQAQVILRGRNVEIPDHFAARIKAKLARVERLDPSILRFEVELRHEKNPRQSKIRDRVEITARSKGAPARAEAADDNFYAALESAVDKMERSLRKVKVRRKISRSGHRTPISVAEATAVFAHDDATAIDPEVGFAAGLDNQDPYASEDDNTPGRIVRSKTHEAAPMSVDDASYQMELVGHDFYLFLNSETGKASVVYRRHAYDYGLITLGE